MSKAFTSEETPEQGPVVRAPPRLAPGEVRCVTPQGAAALRAQLARARVAGAGGGGGAGAGLRDRSAPTSGWRAPSRWPSRRVAASSSSPGQRYRG